MSAIQDLIAQRRAAKVPETWRGHLVALHGQLLRARKAAKIPQSEMAIRLGVDRKTFASWEASKADPRAEDLFRWADVLGVDITFEVRS